MSVEAVLDERGIAETEQSGSRRRTPFLRGQQGRRRGVASADVVANDQRGGRGRGVTGGSRFRP